MPQVFPKPRTNPFALSRTLEPSSTRTFAAPAVGPAWDAPWPLRLWHLSSLDAPTVAVVWTLGFARAAGAALPKWVPALLAFSAWAFYIADRLQDARTALPAAPHLLRERHFFHWRFRRLFVPIGAAAACGAAWLVVTRAPVWMVERGSVLGAAALAYFTGVHFLRLRRKLASLLSKELLVGVLFTAACALPTWYRVRTGGTAHAPLLAPAVLFGLLAWLNCHLIEEWENGAERGDARPLALPAVALVLTGAALAIALAAVGYTAAGALAACAALSALSLALLDRLRRRLTPIALRAAADLVLLTPLLLLALPRQ